jgi:hypothetical protein
MARIGRRSCLSVALIGLTTAALAQADPADDPSPAVASALAVQDAMRQGRDMLQKGQAKAAVEVLEGQLSRINGNPSYLMLLREAYYAYLKELQLAHQDELCAVYQKRLQILEKSARPDTPPPPPKTPGLARANAEAPPGTDKVARGVRADDDPLQQTPKRERPTGRALLPEAEKAFAERRYREADDLFARAYGSDAAAPAHGSQWAYCKLYAVFTRLKAAEAGSARVPAGELEQEVAAALRLAANDLKLDAFGKQLLEAIRQRAAAPAAPPVTVTHQERGADGWARAESANFRLYHKQPRDFAEQMLRAAEQARVAAFEKWAGVAASDWKPVCDVYLYPAAADYARATGKPADSPGYATLQTQNGTVVSRRLDFRADEPSLLTGVLPHETTHLVLGDLFADAPLPRWADEGMAVLAESRARFDRYARTLHSWRRQGRLVPLTQLFARPEYPDAALITAFYVESVSVVDFLVGEKDPRAFVQFLRDVPKAGLDAALEKHYGCRGVADLQERWLVKTFAEADARAAAGR